MQINLNRMSQKSQTLVGQSNQPPTQGIVDLHFDLPMELYEKRHRRNVLATEFLPQLEAGNVGIVGAAIYIEDSYLPERALAVALGQIAQLYVETERCGRLAICKSYKEIIDARASGRVALVITMEGVEPLGTDLELVRIFYELGVRCIGLTHARANAAGHGGIFAATGSSPAGLTPFGREVVRQCESLGVIIDLAHLNPAGFQEVIQTTTKPVVVSHTNARRFYDIERNISDEQIRMIGQRGGVIGVNSVLVSPRKEQSTLDRYVDHIEHVASLIGIDGVGIGFDFFEFIYRQWPDTKKKELAAKLAEPHFISDLSNHSQAGNLTPKLIERGFSSDDIDKILFQNWMRIFEEVL
jgi:membrane dipeptidase